MRARVLLLTALALAAAAGVAGAATSKTRLVRVVKRDGAITATLSYRAAKYYTYRPTLVVRRNGRVLLAHRLCAIDYVSPKGPCAWEGPDTWLFMKHGHLALRAVGPNGTPAAVVDLWLGGAHCCEETFMALLGSRPMWIARDWGNPGYRGRRIGGHYYFVSGDDRFSYAFGPYAFSWFPPQIWTIRYGRLVNVTRTMPALVAANERRAWRQYLRARSDPAQARGIGVLAGWCADEFLLGRGARCERTIHRTRAAGFVRTLNRDLERWGYKG